jgi:hypothetical protein
VILAMIVASSNAADMALGIAGIGAFEGRPDPKTWWEQHWPFTP